METAQFKPIDPPNPMLLGGYIDPNLAAFIDDIDFGGDLDHTLSYQFLRESLSDELFGDGSIDGRIARAAQILDGVDNDNSLSPDEKAEIKAEFNGRLSDLQYQMDLERLTQIAEGKVDSFEIENKQFDNSALPLRLSNTRYVLDYILKYNRLLLAEDKARLRKTVNDTLIANLLQGISVEKSRYKEFHDLLTDISLGKRRSLQQSVPYTRYRVPYTKRLQDLEKALESVDSSPILSRDYKNILMEKGAELRSSILTSLSNRSLEGLRRIYVRKKLSGTQFDQYETAFSSILDIATAQYRKVNIAGITRHNWRIKDRADNIMLILDNYEITNYFGSHEQFTRFKEYVIAGIYNPLIAKVKGKAGNKYEAKATNLQAVASTGLMCTRDEPPYEVELSDVADVLKLGESKTSTTSIRGNDDNNYPRGEPARSIELKTPDKTLLQRALGGANSIYLGIINFIQDGVSYLKSWGNYFAEVSVSSNNGNAAIMAYSPRQRFHYSYIQFLLGLYASICMVNLLKPLTYSLRPYDSLFTFSSIDTILSLDEPLISDTIGRELAKPKIENPKPRTEGNGIPVDAAPYGLNLIENGIASLTFSSLESALISCDSTYISSQFGIKRNIFGMKRLHRGTDFAAPKNSLVKALVDFTVLKAGDYHNGYGSAVYGVDDEGNLHITSHHIKGSIEHLSAGDRIHRGEVYARVGKTGTVRGRHPYNVHYVVSRKGHWEIAPDDHITISDYEDMVQFFKDNVISGSSDTSPDGKKQLSFYLPRLQLLAQFPGNESTAQVVLCDPIDIRGYLFGSNPQISLQVELMMMRPSVVELLASNQIPNSNAPN